MIPLQSRAQQQPTPRTPGQSDSQDRTTPEPQTRPSTPEATQRNQSQTPSQPGVAMTTGSFVKKLAEDNQKEVDMARAASSRAKSAEVKNYAQQSPRWGLRFCCANLGV